MRVEVNLDAVERPAGIEEPGTYKARISDANLVPLKDDPGGPLANVAVVYAVPREGKKDGLVYDNFSIKPSAQWKIQDLFRACGLTWNEDGSFDTESLLGAELQIVVGMRSYEGRERPNVSRYLPL